MTDTSVLKELRDLTGAGMGDINEALKEAGGDKDAALDILRKKGTAKLAKKADRHASEGMVESYIHAGGRVGVIVELNCETDFVARTDDFQALAKDLALHIAAANPLYIDVTDVPEEVIEKEREIYKEQMKDSGKPDAVVEQIIEGKVSKFYEEVCLLKQPFVKDPSTTIHQLISNSVAKMGENVKVRRFARFALGN